MSDEHHSRDQAVPCTRCGRPAERPAAVPGPVAGREEDVPLCVDCLQRLLEILWAFWDGPSRRADPPAD